MKIIVVTDYFRPGNSRVQEEHVTRLGQRGHDVVLLAGNESPDELSSRLEDRPVTPHIFHYDPKGSRILQYFRIRREIQKLWTRLTRDSDPDLLLFNQPLTARFVLKENQSDAVPIYVHHAPWHEEWTVHHPPPDNRFLKLAQVPHQFLQQKIRHRIERSVLTSCQQILVLSRFMKDRVRNNHPGIPENRIRTNPGGIDTERFRPAENPDALKERHGIDPKRPVLLSVRRLVPRMGIKRLIRAFGALQSNHDGDPILLIVGEGPQREELENLADSVAPEDIRFEGYVAEEHLPEYYQMADLSVVPTAELEGFGLVILEAMASGVPVLATPVGGIPEILEPFDPDLLLPEFDPEGWGDVINQMLGSNKMDDAYRDSCRRYVKENFSWERGIDKLLECYERIRSKNATSSSST